jgi:large conductance mechanosensitive channel
MLKDFRKFVLRGNVVDLAVAVVIGAAFNSVVQSLVKDFITPLIKGISRNGQLVQGKLSLADGRFVLDWGDFLNALISFLIVAGVVFFFVVQPVNKLVAYANKHDNTDEPTTIKCPHCLSEIPKAAKVCAHCTRKVS